MKGKAEKTVLVLQHVPNEGLGTLAPFFASRNIRVESVALYAGEKIPSGLDRVLAVCVMGGPMNVDEEEKFPFLREELSFIRRLIDKEVPCLGICLGAQLIAKAAGGRVYKASLPEIGWQDVRLTEQAKNDPLFSVLPFPFFRVLQWHEDTFDLPRRAELLASSPSVPHQAYRLGRNAYGLQFHIEVTRDMLEDWFIHSPDRKNILEEFEGYREKLGAASEALYNRFLSLSLKTVYR